MMTGRLVLEALNLTLRLQQRTYGAMMAGASNDEIMRLATLADRAADRWKRRERQLYSEANQPTVPN